MCERRKAVIVTGGTSRIGRVVVKMLAENGFDVIFSFFKNKPLKDNLEKLGAKGCFLNLEDEESLKNFSFFIRKLLCSEKSIFALINNAAVVRDSSIVKMRESDWDSVFFANYTAQVLLIKYLAPFMVFGGKILNITSQSGLHGAAGQANYSASKGALIYFTKFAAFSLYKRNGLIVNALNPGLVFSDMTASLPEDILEKHRKMSPFFSYTSEEEIARFILYYLSAVEMVTGQVFSIDGRVI